MLGIAFEFENFPSTNTPYNATNLNNMQKLLVDLIYPVGTYYETSNNDFNPNTSWGGTWELETDGTVLVSSSSDSGSAFNDETGTTVGAETHTLTTSEMPSHGHSIHLNGSSITGNSVLITSSWSWSENYQNNSAMIEQNGGGEAHNNVQPSKIINRWHRTA